MRDSSALLRAATKLSFYAASIEEYIRCKLVKANWATKKAIIIL